MATQKLTDKTIAAARAQPSQRVELWDELTPGLCLRVSAVGDQQRRVWVWRYRTPDGRQPRLTLADYSEQHGLKWARQQVEKWRVRVREGADPAGERRKDKANAKAEPLKTFNDLADAFLAASEKGHWKPRRKQKRPTTIATETAVLRRNVRPVIGKLRLEQVDRRAIRAILTGMLDRGIGTHTNKTHAVIRQVFAYALAEERLITNPAVGIDKPVVDRPRVRVLSDLDLKALWTILNDCPPKLRLPPTKREPLGKRLYIGEAMRIALRLTILLLNRRNEIAGMRIQELNLDQGTWLIPAERMKGGQSHLVALPPMAVLIIKDALKIAKGGQEEQPEPVFPSPRNSAKSVKPDSITHAMAGLCAILDIKDASPHDLRRTGSTLMTSERLSISPFIRSKILAHNTDTGGGATVSSAHYDANSYIAEKRRALEAWEGLLLEIVGEEERRSNVASLGQVIGL